MATLFIGVWAGASVVLMGEPVQEITVTVAATSAQSSVIAGQSKTFRHVRLQTDTDCFVNWGSDPTAKNDGTAGRALGAENPEVFGIEAGHKIAVIERT